jgi:hypothetical protein
MIASARIPGGQERTRAGAHEEAGEIAAGGIMNIRRRKRITRKGERREASSWRDILKIHPAAELFPRMSDDELRELAADIKAHGLKQPIVLWSPGYSGDGMKDRPRYVLDGINRLDAMELDGRPVVSDEGELTDLFGARFHQLWEKKQVHSIAIAGRGKSSMKIKLDTDPYAYVISANIRRRHLTAEQKRGLIVKLIKATPEKSDRQIAGQIKASPTTVGTVRAKMEAAGDVSKLDTRKDTKGRRQPARKPQSRKVPIESQKQAARQVVKHMAAANAESEVNEVARLRARIHELETEVNQLKHKNLALQSKVDELRARLGDAPRYSRSR